MTIVDLDQQLARMRDERDATQARWAAERAALNQAVFVQSAWMGAELDRRHDEMERRAEEEGRWEALSVEEQAAIKARWMSEDSRWAQTRAEKDRQDQVILAWMAARDIERNATFARWEAEEARHRDGLPVAPVQVVWS